MKSITWNGAQVDTFRCGPKVPRGGVKTLRVGPTEAQRAEVYGPFWKYPELGLGTRARRLTAQRAREEAARQGLGVLSAARTADSAPANPILLCVPSQ